MPAMYVPLINSDNDGVISLFLCFFRQEKFYITEFYITDGFLAWPVYPNRISDAKELGQYWANSDALGSWSE